MASENIIKNDYTSPHNTIESLKHSASQKDIAGFKKGFSKQIIDLDFWDMGLREVLNNEVKCMELMGYFLRKDFKLTKPAFEKKDFIKYHYRYKDDSEDYRNSTGTEDISFSFENGSWFICDID